MRKLEDMSVSTRIFLNNMYTYLGEQHGHNGHYEEQNGLEMHIQPYPFEDFVSSRMGQAAARAFDEWIVDESQTS